MELLPPLKLSRILKLHPFTVTRLAREDKLPPLGRRLPARQALWRGDFGRISVSVGLSSGRMVRTSVVGVTFQTVNRWFNRHMKPGQIHEYHIRKLLKNGASPRSRRSNGTSS